MTDSNPGGAATAAGSGANGLQAPAQPISQPATNQSNVDWTTGLNDEMKGYVQTKGFKAPQDVLESYKNFEKLHGVPQERILKIPDNIDLATPEGRAIFERLGAPKEAKDYNIQIPKENGDEGLSNWIREVAYKNGFTNRQVEGLVQSWNERASGSMKAQTDAQAASLKEASMNLQKEWGSAFEQNKALADQGAQALGMNEEQVSALGKALGPDKAMMLLHKLATATGEASYISGTPARGGISTPTQAQSKINDLIKDASFASRLSNGDADAKAQWDKLHVEAAAGQMVSL